MTKEGEGVAGATKSSENLIGKVIKTCEHVRWGLAGDGFEIGKHDLIMSCRRGHVQCDGWKNGYVFV